MQRARHTGGSRPLCCQMLIQRSVIGKMEEVQALCSRRSRDTAGWASVTSLIHTAICQSSSCHDPVTAEVGDRP